MSRADTFGVHAVALTPQGKVVLVRLTYAPGWYLPGGGKKAGETAEDGALRELREEIGLRAWSSIEQVSRDERVARGRRDHTWLFLVRDALYQAHRSLEIAEVREFDPTDLPSDTSPWAAGMLRNALAGGSNGIAHHAPRSTGPFAPPSPAACAARPGS